MNERANRIINGLIVKEGEGYRTYTLQERMDYFHTTAFSIACIDQYKIDFVYSTGTTEHDGGTKVNDQTPFMAASVSKAVFAVALMKLVHESAFRQEVASAIFASESQSLLKFSGFDGCLILGAPKTPDAVGQTIAQIAKQRGTDEISTVFDLLMENRGDVDAAYFYQNEQDMLQILASPFVMGGTDSGHNIMQFDREQQGGAHPRAMSTFPKRLRLVRERNILPLEEEIRRICYLPAEMCKLDGIGLLLEGYHADICVFDWEQIRENNDYHHPFRKNTGIELVVVNGEIAVQNGDYTGMKAGRLARRRNPRA